MAGVAAGGGSGCEEDALLSELGQSARFGGVMGRDEILRWSWYDAGVSDTGASLDRLLRKGDVLERDGFLTVAGMGHLFASGNLGRERAGRRLRTGACFIEELSSSCPGVMMAGVSGSVSYGTSRKDDDIDILLITSGGSLWKVVKHALLEARRRRRIDPDMPVICLSYCMEYDSFRDEVASHRSRLFARDFLRLKTFTGAGVYRQLLSENGWIGDYYPRIYAERMKALEECSTRTQPSPCAADRLEYESVGSYLRLSALARNVLFRIRGRKDRAFRAIVRRDRCIYESGKWRELESGLEPLNTVI